MDTPTQNRKGKLNAKNEVDKNNVSACINFPEALITKKFDSMYGLKERKLFFNLLKDILDYENCKK